MSDYSPFAHLRRSLCLLGTDLVASFSIYLDDSGTDRNSRVAVVAGYMSTVAQWEIFEKEWLTVLNDVGIQAVRMADLENLRGEFRQWDPQRGPRKFGQCAKW